MLGKYLLMLGTIGIFTSAGCSQAFLDDLKGASSPNTKEDKQDKQQVVKTTVASSEPDPAHKSPSTKESLALKTLSEANISHIKESKTQVVKNQADFESLWQAHTGSLDNLPEVDFTQEMVLAVFMGEKSTGGYSIQITDAVLDNGQLTVSFKESAPPPDAFVIQVLTAPSHIVSLKKVDAEVKFKKSSPS